MGASSPRNKCPRVRWVQPILRHTATTSSFLMQLKTCHTWMDGITACNLLPCVCVHSSCHNDRTTQRRDVQRPLSRAQISIWNDLFSSCIKSHCQTGLHGQLPRKRLQTSMPYGGATLSWPTGLVSMHVDSARHLVCLSRWQNIAGFEAEWRQAQRSTIQTMMELCKW
jgi:hypothetical protein